MADVVDLSLDDDDAGSVVILDEDEDDEDEDDKNEDDDELCLVHETIPSFRSTAAPSSPSDDLTLVMEVTRPPQSLSATPRSALPTFLPMFFSSEFERPRTPVMGGRLASLSQGGVGGRAGQNQGQASLVSESSTWSSSENPRKRRRGRRQEDPELPKMQRGKKGGKNLTDWQRINLYNPYIKAPERTRLLAWLFPMVTTSSLNAFRTAYEKRQPKPTVWDLARAVADTLDSVSSEGDDSKGAAQENQGQSSSTSSISRPPLKIKRATKSTALCTSAAPSSSSSPAAREEAPQSPSQGTAGRPTNSLPDVDPPNLSPAMTAQVLRSLKDFVDAWRERMAHARSLESPEAAEDTPQGDLSCVVCSESFAPDRFVACQGEDETHFICAQCFNSYVLVTVKPSSLAMIKCPIPSCDAHFASACARRNLSRWDVLQIVSREEELNQRVALAAKAVLHCECGVVAIVTDEDFGDGIVRCPGCSCSFCAKCGNDAHGSTACPPPAETLQWMQKFTKQCPNCHHAIQKNGGCDHMTCDRASGGCGHEFWWSCGCKYPTHIAGCPRPGER